MNAVGPAPQPREALWKKRKKKEKKDLTVSVIPVDSAITVICGNDETKGSF
jgi:hypothetical protein